jgi:hypothetical protein
MINSMKCGFLYLILPLLLALRVGAAVVVTSRGDAPNTFNYLPLPSDVDFDVNSDGISDFRFLSDGSFVAAIQSYGTNRFISTLASGLDIGGSVTAISAGSIIGSDTSLLVGSWHIHTDNGGGSMFDLNFGPMSLQVSDAFIGVEFAAADGIHYGWIQYVGYSHPEKGLGYYLPGGFIDSWGWETLPGVSIVAGAIPEPSTITLVVVSALSLMQRRRKK